MLTWHQTRNDLAVTGLGNQGLLALPMTAFFASRQCPGIAIRAAMAWALQRVKTKSVVVSGFHSPLEQSVLKVLLQARSPAVAVLARPVDGAKLPTEWAESIAQGHLTVVSSATKLTRLTQDAATARNDHAAHLADNIVVAYTSPNGALADLCAQWQSQGRQLVQLAS